MRAASDSRSLVLLDEVGTGTEPVEGSALGVALLEILVKGSRGGAGFTMATTHHRQALQGLCDTIIKDCLTCCSVAVLTLLSERRSSMQPCMMNECIAVVAHQAISTACHQGLASYQNTNMFSVVIHHILCSHLPYHPLSLAAPSPLSNLRTAPLRTRALSLTSRN